MKPYLSLALIVLAFALAACGQRIERVETADPIVHSMPAPVVNVTVQNGNTITNSNSQSQNSENNSSGGSANSNATGGSSSATGGSNSNEITSGNSTSSGGAGGNGGAGGQASAGNSTSTSNANNSGTANTTNSGTAQNSANNSTSNSSENSATGGSASNSNQNTSNSNSSNANTNTVDIASYEMEFSNRLDLDRNGRCVAEAPTQAGHSKVKYTRGARCKFYDLISTQPSSLPTFTTMTEVAQFNADQLNGPDADYQTILPFVPTSLASYKTWYGIVCEGFLRMPETATTMSLTSDDGSHLYLDGTLVINNNNLHSVVTQTGNVSAYAGKMTKFRVEYMQGPANRRALELKLDGNYLPLYRKVN